MDRSVTAPGAEVVAHQGTISMTRTLALLLLAMTIHGYGQTTIRDRHGSTVAKISSDGRVTDSSGSSLGRIKKDGRVVNSHGSSVGRIKKDGRLVNSHGSSIGRVSGGRLTNRHGSSVGRIHSGGRISDSHGSTIGRASGNWCEKHVVAYFAFFHQGVFGP